MGSTCRAVEPWELVAAEVTAAPADRSLASDGEDGELSGFDGGGGLTQLGTPVLASISCWAGRDHPEQPRAG